MDYDYAQDYQDARDARLQEAEPGEEAWEAAGEARRLAVRRGDYLRALDRITEENLRAPRPRTRVEAEADRARRDEQTRAIARDFPEFCC